MANVCEHLQTLHVFSRQSCFVPAMSDGSCQHGVWYGHYGTQYGHYGTQYVAGPSTMEPIVEQLGQDMPSVIQGARPDVRIEQTAQSTQRYGTLPYIPGPQYMAPLPQYTAPLPQYTAPKAPLPYAAPYATMPAMSARPAGPMGYYGQGSQFPFVPNPGWMTEEQLLQQQQLLREKQEFDAWRASQAQANIQPQPQITSEGPVPAEANVDISQRSASVARARPEDQITSKAKAKHARSASTLADPPVPRGTTLGGLAQPLGHLRPVPGWLSKR